MFVILAMLHIKPALAFRFAALFKDERGAVLIEYALVTTAFAILMLTLLLSVQHDAGHNITTTQNSLTNEASSP